MGIPFQSGTDFAPLDDVSSPAQAIVTVLIGGVVWAGALARMLCEERFLTERYPEYPQYAGRTARMVPGIF